MLKITLLILILIAGGKLIHLIASLAKSKFGPKKGDIDLLKEAVLEECENLERDLKYLRWTEKVLGFFGLIDSPSFKRPEIDIDPRLPHEEQLKKMKWYAANLPGAKPFTPTRERLFMEFLESRERGLFLSLSSDPMAVDWREQDSILNQKTDHEELKRRKELFKAKYDWNKWRELVNQRIATLRSQGKIDWYDSEAA